MFMLVITVLINWFVIFIAANMFISTESALLVSVAIAAVLVALSVSPVAEYLVRLELGCRDATRDEADIFGSAWKRAWNRAREDESAEYGFPSLEREPTVYVANNKYPNAYAIGNRSVVVTTGLLGNASDEELEGLLAHEIGHIVHGDSVKRTVASTINTAGNIACWIMVGIIALLAFLGEIFGGRSGIITLVALAFAFVALIMKLALKLVQYLLELGMLAVGRSEEYRADAYAKSLGFGHGLGSFLSRVQYIESSHRGSGLSFPARIRRWRRGYAVWKRIKHGNASETV